MKSEISKKIKKAVDSIVPANQEYSIYASPTGFDDTEVIRVITPAWNKMGKAERIAKVQQAVLPKLKPDEKTTIFRFSVLTPKEWDGIRTHSVEKETRKVGYRRKKLA